MLCSKLLGTVAEIWVSAMHCSPLSDAGTSCLSSSDLMCCCHGAGIKMVLWKPLPASELCGVSSHTSLLAYSVRRCLSSTLSHSTLLFLYPLISLQNTGQNIPQGWSPRQCSLGEDPVAWGRCCWAGLARGPTLLLLMRRNS